MYPRQALSELFDIKKQREKNFEITIVMSLLEIYMVRSIFYHVFESQTFIFFAKTLEIPA